jgi:hypothetical protein
MPALLAGCSNAPEKRVVVYQLTIVNFSSQLFNNDRDDCYIAVKMFSWLIKVIIGKLCKQTLF